ncbi:hypothetical protein EVAR_66080_1 [Eumeta japonica]|uniref:Uncharacterized protein n=1 Tax=Eumeta variegata TaxID=151549 RepID=A0A4C2A4K5_EUMVA|nr:hypothetical protein EVAR_66080_1 [Eumeta japonica]
MGEALSLLCLILKECLDALAPAHSGPPPCTNNYEDGPRRVARPLGFELLSPTPTFIGRSPRAARPNVAFFNRAGVDVSLPRARRTCVVDLELFRALFPQRLRRIKLLTPEQLPRTNQRRRALSHGFTSVL